MVKGKWPSGRPRGWINAYAPAAPLSAAWINSASSGASSDAGGIRLPEPPLAEHEKGAIVFTRGEFSGDANSLVVGAEGAGGYDEDLLRATMLLFDKTDFVKSVGLEFPAPPEEYTCFGNSQRTEVYLGPAPASLLSLQEIVFRAFSALDDRDKGQWVLTRSVNNLQFPDHAFAPDKAVALTLYDALPVPTAEVPYEDVLNFKNRRSDELLALRSFLDELGLQASQGIGGLAETVAMRKFDSALANYNKAIAEQNFAKKLRSITANFQLSDASIGVAVELVRQLTCELPLTSAMNEAMWTVPPTFVAAIVRGLRAPSMEGKPFEYILHAHRELR